MFLEVCSIEFLGSHSQISAYVYVCLKPVGIRADNILKSVELLTFFCYHYLFCLQDMFV